MNLRTTIIRGIKWQLIEIVSRQTISLLIFALLARLLDPAAFGLAGLVAVYLAFINIFIDQGIGSALVQRRELQGDHLNAAFWFNLGCGSLLCASTMLFADLLARGFGEPRLAGLLRWASLSLIANASTVVHAALFVRDLNFRTPMMRTLIANLVGGACGIAMALAGYGVWALIGQQLIASLTGVCFLWAASSWRPSVRCSRTHLRELLAVSSSVLLTGALWFFSSRLDQLVIGRVAGATILGQYVVAGKLVEVARMVVHQPVANISLPALSRLQDSHEKLRAAIYRGMELNALISFAVFGGLAAIAPSIVPIAFGHEWKPAIPFLQLLSVYNLMAAQFVYCHPALLASGGPGRYVLISFACAAGAAAACFAGIMHGPMLVVSGLTLNISGIGIVALFFLRNRIGLDPSRYLRPCVVPAIAAGAMFAAVQGVREAMVDVVPPWIQVALEVLIGGGTYVLCITLLAYTSLIRLKDVIAHAITRKLEPV